MSKEGQIVSDSNLISNLFNNYSISVIKDLNVRVQGHILNEVVTTVLLLTLVI